MKGQRKPGRPVGSSTTQSEDEGETREQLMRSASILFAEKGADAVSLREVAEAADLSPAMINYYFKNKQGLKRAVLERGLDHVLAVITAVAESESTSVTTSFIEHYITAITRDPALPQLMIREVLSADASYQKVISERFAKRALELMPPRLIEDMRKGRLRGDLDPRFLMLSLVGMCVFPFIAAPLVKPLLGFEYDEAFALRLIDHTTQLFNEGARGREGEHHD